MTSWSVEAIIAFVTLLATCIPLLAYFLRKFRPQRQIARSDVGMLVDPQYCPSLASNVEQMLSLETWTRIMVVLSSSRTLGYVKAEHGRCWGDTASSRLWVLTDVCISSMTL